MAGAASSSWHSYLGSVRPLAFPGPAGSSGGPVAESSLSLWHCSGIVRLLAFPGPAAHVARAAVAEALCPLGIRTGNCTSSCFSWSSAGSGGACGTFVTLGIVSGIVRPLAFPGPAAAAWWRRRLLACTA